MFTDTSFLLNYTLVIVNTYIWNVFVQCIATDINYTNSHYFHNLGIYIGAHSFLNCFVVMTEIFKRLYNIRDFTIKAIRFAIACFMVAISSIIILQYFKYIFPRSGPGAYDYVYEVPFILFNVFFTFAGAFNYCVSTFDVFSEEAESKTNNELSKDPKELPLISSNPCEV